MLDIERLKDDLADYFGTAMQNNFPMAVMDLIEIPDGSSDNLSEAQVMKLINIAISNGIDLDKYDR